MGRKAPPTLTEQDDDHFPGLTIKREKLQNAIDTLRGQAYDANIQLVVANAGIGKEVAIPLSDGRAKMVKKEDHLTELEDSITNARRSITALKRLLAGLPKDREPNEPDIVPEEETA